MVSLSYLEKAVTIAINIKLEDTPDTALKRAGHIIADTVGVSCAGSRQPEVVHLLRLKQKNGDVNSGYNGGSTLMGHPNQKAAPETAAFLNATAGSFVELDEGMRPTGHPGMQVVIPAIAQAEKGKVDGKKLLRAVVVGYEVTSRLFSAYRLHYPVHPHGHFGAVGGAVAVALLTGQDPVEMAKIASTSPILSVWNACLEGATARNTWMGRAAALAIQSSELELAGFSGSPTGLDAAFGKIAGELVNHQVLIAPLDYNNLGLNRNYFKLFSTCALSHTAIEAALKLPYTRPDDIESVIVETVSNNMKLNCQARPNNLSARFSLPYIIAAALYQYELTADKFVFDRNISGLAERVTITVAEDLEEQWPDSAPARVTVITRGSEVSAEVNNPHGHHTDPLSREEIKSKFMATVANDAVGALWWDKLTNLSDVSDCARLLDVC